MGKLTLYSCSNTNHSHAIVPAALKGLLIYCSITYHVVRLLNTQMVIRVGNQSVHCPLWEGLLELFLTLLYAGLFLVVYGVYFSLYQIIYFSPLAYRLYR